MRRALCLAPPLDLVQTLDETLPSLARRAEPLVDVLVGPDDRGGE